VKELEWSYGIFWVDTLDGLQPNSPSTSDFPLPLCNAMVFQIWLEDNKFSFSFLPCTPHFQTLVGYMDSAYYIGPNSVVQELIRLGIVYLMTWQDA